MGVEPQVTLLPCPGSSGVLVPSGNCQPPTNAQPAMQPRRFCSQRQTVSSMRLMRARASVQQWGSGYLYDPTAKEYFYTHTSVVVKAFGHDIYVPRNALLKYRTWKRKLPIGRILLKWNQQYKLFVARLKPSTGPY